MHMYYNTTTISGDSNEITDVHKLRSAGYKVTWLILMEKRVKVISGEKPYQDHVILRCHVPDIESDG